MLDSELPSPSGRALSFLLLPTDGGVSELLAPLGLAEAVSDGHGPHGGDRGVAAPGDELVARGLGSCIGLALVDRVAAWPGWPTSCCPRRRPGIQAPGKFADRAVPARSPR